MEMFIKEARLYEMEINAEIVDHIFNVIPRNHLAEQ